MIAAYFMILLTIDQLTKYWARTSLAEQQSVEIIKNFFYLTYVENRGAAFGLFQGQQIIFLFATVVAVAALLYYYFLQKKKNAVHIKSLSFIVATIIAGAVGNLIDRLLLGFVTDMIDVQGIWVFVFNVADIYVVCATILLGLYILKFDAEK